MKLITTINNAEDAMAALNQNYNMLTTGKRKILDAKEVNNTIGKMTGIVKVQVMYAMLTKNPVEIPWLTTSPNKQIENK